MPNKQILDNPNFFGQGSPYLSHPLLTPQRTTREVDFVLSCIDLPEGGRLLDVGCGPGRHSIELAKRGYEVVGIDPSPAMIEAAQERALGIEPAPTFLTVRADDLSNRASFDAAICLFTTLGQIEETMDNSQLVFHVAKKLRPGGYFIVEVPQRSWVLSNLKEYERLGTGDRYTDVTRRYDAHDFTLTETFNMISPHAERAYLLQYRLYNQAELRSLLTSARYEILGCYGDYDGAPLGEDSRVMIMLAQKRQ